MEQLYITTALAKDVFNTCICAAGRRGDIKELTWLIEWYTYWHGDKVGRSESDHEILNTAIQIACSKGDIILLRLLIIKCHGLNADDANLLLVAVFHGSVECVELLINEFHYDINTKDDFGGTILHIACEEGHTSLVRHLVTKYSSDLNARDRNGDTPFTNAGFGGSVECVELLINEFHCDINTQGAYGRTILHNACIKGHTSLVRHLVTKYSCASMLVMLMAICSRFTYRSKMHSLLQHRSQTMCSARVFVQQHGAEILKN